MITRYLNKFIRLSFLSSLILIFIWSCGQDENSPYDQNGKIFSSVKSESSELGKPVVPEIIDSTESEAMIDISPEMIIFHGKFQGRLDYDSIRIFSWSFWTLSHYLPHQLPWGLSRYVPLKFLRELGEMMISMEARQNYGTPEYAETVQNIDFPIAQVAEESDDPKAKTLFPNGDIYSGEYRFHSVKLGCPTGFGCVDRLDVIPKDKGLESRSYCYFDAADQPTFVVSGVSPTAEHRNFADNEIEFGPYKTVQVDSGVPCEKADPKKASPLFRLSFEKVLHQDVDAKQSTQSYDMISRTFFIDEEGKRISSFTQPYVDQLTGFQSETTYSIDPVNALFSMVVKRFLIPVARFPYPETGMKVDGVFSFCQDMLDENAPTTCL